MSKRVPVELTKEELEILLLSIKHVKHSSKGLEDLLDFNPINNLEERLKEELERFE